MEFQCLTANEIVTMQVVCAAAGVVIGVLITFRLMYKDGDDD